MLNSFLFYSTTVHHISYILIVISTMNHISLLLLIVTIFSTSAQPTAVEVATEIVSNCLLKFQISGCVKPRAVSWANQVADDNVIRITEDLYLLKKFDPAIQVREILGLFWLNNCYSLKYHLDKHIAIPNLLKFLEFSCSVWRESIQFVKKYPHRNLFTLFRECSEFPNHIQNWFSPGNNIYIWTFLLLSGSFSRGSFVFLLT